MKMTKWTFILCICLMSLATAACGSDADKPDGFDVSEEERGQNEETDCDETDGTQSDSECADVCAEVRCCIDLPHPDGCCEGAHCSPPIDCPTDSEVDYLPGSREDYSICQDDNWSCASAPEGIFDDPECGCGCYIEESACPSPSDPNVTYVSEDPAQCADLDYQCEPDEEQFSDECGCGCIRNPECHDADDPDIQYVGESVDECAVIFFACEEEGQDHFENACGCGCVRAH